MLKPFFYFFLAAVAIWIAYLLLYSAYLAAARAVRAYRKFRGAKVVVCPETRRHVAVELDTRHAASTAAASDVPELRLRSCTRWRDGERAADCDQDCLWQVERAPLDCAAETMLTSFYAGKSCAFCGRPVGEINWHDHKPALVRPDDLRTFAWREIAPEHLPEVLAAYLPACWNCHVAESFRAEHPDLIVERPAPPPGESRLIV